MDISDILDMDREIIRILVVALERYADGEADPSIAITALNAAANLAIHDIEKMEEVIGNREDGVEERDRKTH